MGSPGKFQQSGESGLWVSELFPEVASRADELCVVRHAGRDMRLTDVKGVVHKAILA